MSSQIVSLVAPAKLTVSLKVTGVRADGFHLIDAEMVTLELADELDVDVSRTGLEIIGKFSGNLSATNQDLTNNLVSRALLLAGRKAHVRVTKNIPAGGGFGRRLG